MGVTRIERGFTLGEKEIKDDIEGERKWKDGESHGLQICWVEGVLKLGY